MKQLREYNRFSIYRGRNLEMWIPTLAQLAERRTVDVIEFLRSLVRLRQVGSFFMPDVEEIK